MDTYPHRLALGSGLGKGFISRGPVSPERDRLPVDGLVITPTGRDSNMSVYMRPMSAYMDI